MCIYNYLESLTNIDNLFKNCFKNDSVKCKYLDFMKNVIAKCELFGLHIFFIALQNFVACLSFSEGKLEIRNFLFKLESVLQKLSCKFLLQDFSYLTRKASLLVQV